jgi:type I restriction enzyme, S subunit
MKQVSLGEVAQVNPARIPLEGSSLCTFVPMDAVDEVAGAIVKYTERYVDEVANGYTPFKDDDVLFAKITPCMENGKCAIARGLTNGVGFGSTEFHIVRAGRHILPEWIYYFLRQESTRKAAARYMTGSAGQQRVPVSFVENVTIPLPTVEEQRRKATVLMKVDRLLRLRRHALEVGEAFLQAVFMKMFENLLTVHANGNHMPLDDVADIASGVTKGQRFNGRQTVTVPYLRVANVQDGYLDLTEVKTIEALPADVEHLRLRPGDVLMTEGGDFDKLGRGAVWRGEIDPCIHQNHIFRVRLDQNAVLPAFFEAVLQSPYAKSYFLRASKQTTNLATINMTQLKAFPVPAAHMEEQRKFCMIELKHLLLVTKQREALRQAQTIFDALMHSSFSLLQS